tara:strand:- start:175 stop:438 length:264 start_codon:yes stop_codon:yes gene_type:complete
MKLSLNEYITDEFPSAEYDPDIIKGLVEGYKGEINLNGNLLPDNIDLFDYIYDSFVDSGHPGMKPVSNEELVDMGFPSMENYSPENN